VASVTCAVTEPSDARPNEGRLVVAVEFSPTAAPRCADGGYAASDNAVRSCPSDRASITNDETWASGHWYVCQ
jgi:exosome complex RNA-binding protein Rrp42 (RNase PH superfamily)